MGYKPLDVIKNTLDKTTQLAMVEEDNPSLNQMRRHYKKRLPFTNCRYINDVAYADVMHSGQKTGVAIENDDLALIVCFRDNTYLWSGAMHRLLNVYEQIEIFFIEVGCPLKIVTDPAGILKGKPWEKLLSKYHVDSGKTETNLPCQDRAERWIGYVKDGVLRMLDNTGAPMKVWRHFLNHFCAIHNSTALRSTGGIPPHEIMFGESKDISVFWNFKPWDKVRYLVKSRKFPFNKEMPARFVGGA